LALALRKRRPDWTLKLWARSPRSASIAAGAFPDVTTDARHAAAGASLVVFCTPIGAMQELAEQILPVLSPQAVVTDAGSVKSGVVQKLQSLCGGRFIGSHPMAGSERNGFTAAREDLFAGATCILTPTEATEAEARQAALGLWQAVGCRTAEMTPEEHDEVIARVSHLPHAVAAALVAAINVRVPDAGATAGGGYRDTTRVAAGPAGMWTEILLENREPLLAGMDELAASLETMKNLIKAGDSEALEAFLANASAIRKSLP